MLGEGEFIYFVLFEAAVMLSALGIYSRLTLKRMPGAAAILAGLLISTVAAILQACGPYYFTFVWTFDHNGLYHLVQMPGLLLFYLGAGAVAGQAAVDDRRE